MKIHVAIALGAIGVSLLGCTHAFFRSPAQADIREAVPDDWISAAWLTRYRSEVEEKIASYIFERYPTIPDGIAGISVGKVTVTNKVKERNRTALESTERELQILFTDVADKVLGKRSRTIQVDIAATFMRPKTSDAETAAFVALSVPMLVLCGGSIFMVCPGGGTNYVVLDATVTYRGGSVTQIRGVGGATLVASTVVVGDSDDPRMNGELEANTKAMAAAVADLSTKLVPHLQSE